MELTSLETTTPQWSVQDAIATFTPNHMTAVAGLDCQSADAAVLAQTIQSILTTPADSSVLASHMQFMQAVAGNQSGNQVMLMPPSEALPWMMQQYPMMFLPSQVVPGWTQTLAPSLESPSTAASSMEGTSQVQPPMYTQAVQLRFQDGLQIAASHQQSPNFQSSGSISASPAAKASTSNSPTHVGLAVNPQQTTVQLVNGAISLGQPSNLQMAHQQVVQQQQPHAQGDSSAYAMPPGYSVTRQETNKPEVPKPPKKPLSPYMSFSKSIWSRVKSANPSMSVCEVGAAIGRLWRELDENEKQQYNNAFTNDKVRYDQELQSYLKLTGLQASDLVKPRVKKPPKVVATQAQQPRPSVSTASLPVSQAHNAVPSETAALGASGSGTDNVAVADLVRALPHFSQVWTGGQQYIDPQILAQLGHALFTNSDGTIGLASNIVGLQPQTVNITDDRAMTVLYSQSQELSQPSVNSNQQNDREKVAGASATSVSDATMNQIALGGQWQWHQIAAEESPASGQLRISDEQNLARTLLPKMETKLCDGTAAAAAGQSPAMEISAGSGSTEPDQSQWNQMLPAVREALLEKELLQMRSALSEKTQEAQALMQQLEQANRIIEQLRQQRRTQLGQEGSTANVGNGEVSVSD